MAEVRAKMGGGGDPIRKLRPIGLRLREAEGSHPTLRYISYPKSPSTQ